MGINPLGWMIHEKACHLLRAFDERIEDQFQWITEALAEAKKTLAEPRIQLLPKTPSEKKKRLKMWLRHGTAVGYRRLSNSRTSNFSGSYISAEKSFQDTPNSTCEFPNAEFSNCRANLFDHFSEQTPNALSNALSRQTINANSIASVATQTDDVFIMQSIEPVHRLLGSRETVYGEDTGSTDKTLCNESQSGSVELAEFLSNASETSDNCFCSQRKGPKYVIIDRNEVSKCLTSQLVDKILPPSTSDESNQFVVVQTIVHEFDQTQPLQSIILTFKKTVASDSGQNNCETVLINADGSEGRKRTGRFIEQTTNGLMSKAKSMSSIGKQAAGEEFPLGNKFNSRLKTVMSLAPEIVDLDSGTSFPVEQPAKNTRSLSSSSVSSVSSAGCRSLDSLDVQVSVGADCDKNSISDHRDSVYCAVSYDSYEQDTNSVATASTVGNCDVSGIGVSLGDPTEQVPSIASGVCCNPSSFSLSKLCGTEIEINDSVSDDEGVRDAIKKLNKRQSKIPRKLHAVKQRPSYVVGPRKSLSQRKSLVKGSGVRKTLRKSRLASTHKNSILLLNTKNGEALAHPSAVHFLSPAMPTKSICSSGYRIYRSARRRSSSSARGSVPGTRVAPNLRFQAQKNSARKDHLSGDGEGVGKSGSPRPSNIPVTPVTATKSRIQKLRKLFSPHSKSKTPVPNGTMPVSAALPGPALPSIRSKLQMWRGAELSQSNIQLPGSPSTGKTWYKASAFRHCFNSPRRSSVVENPRAKGQMAPGTNACGSKSTKRFTKGNQKLAPFVDSEQSTTPRRGLFKRLQEKMKTAAKESPGKCPLPVPQPACSSQPKGGLLGHGSETTEVCNTSKPSNTNDVKASVAAPTVCVKSTQDCVISDVGSIFSTEAKDVKPLQDAEMKILIGDCTLDPSASDDNPLVAASSEALSSYDISDLRPDSGDSDGETSPPNKTQVRMVPLWAQGKRLATAVVELHYRSVDVEKLFGRIVPPDLNEMFDKKKPRFDKRTSSSNWEHPVDLRPFQL